MNGGNTMKKLIVLSLLLFLAISLSACGMPQSITFQKKITDVDDVEEILEAQLETENPQVDLDVTITNDIDSD
jgi:hypothetical protein